MSIIKLCLDSVQDSVMGRALYHYHYNNVNKNILALREMLSSTGYPHNGGEHTLTISGTDIEIEVWLELFLECFPSCKQEVKALLKLLWKNKSKGKDKKRFLTLSTIKRHGYDGRTYNWFSDKCQIVDLFRKNISYSLTGTDLRSIPDEYFLELKPFRKEFLISCLTMMKS